MDVGDWLRSLGLPQYEAAFRAHAIEIDVLSELSEGDLESLGVPLGHRKRLLNQSPTSTLAPIQARTIITPRMTECPEDAPEWPVRLIKPAGMLSQSVRRSKLDLGRALDPSHLAYATPSDIARPLTCSAPRRANDAKIAIPSSAGDDSLPNVRRRPSCRPIAGR